MQSNDRISTALMVLAAIVMISIAPTAAIAQNNVTNASGTTTTNATTTNQTTTPTSNSTTTTTNQTTTNATKPSNQTCTCNNTGGNQSTVVVPPGGGNTTVVIPPVTPSNETKLKTMLLTIDTDHATIQRGQTQKITITAATDNGTGIPDARISSLTLNYASGANRTVAAGSTDQNGQFVVSIKIGGNSKPGEFNIIASAKKDGYIDAKAISGFVVNPKSK